MHDEKQCLDAVRLAGEIGADRVYLIRLNMPMDKSGFKRPGLKEELEIYEKSEQIASEYGLQVDNNYTAFDNILFRFLYKKCVRQCTGLINIALSHMITCILTLTAGLRHAATFPGMKSAIF